ncbi:MAG: GIY-YIG nuclease family protein [Chitinophagaceae bacterium]
MNNKELKEQYKQIVFPMGIFQIRNIVNGKIYVESSVNLDKIWNRHYSQLRLSGHPNELLQKEWNEYGEENFKFEIISELKVSDDDTFDPKKELKTLEKMFFEELKPYGEKGYHSTPK